MFASRSDSRSDIATHSTVQPLLGCRLPSRSRKALVQDAHQGLGAANAAGFEQHAQLVAGTPVGREAAAPTNHWLLSASTTRNTIWRASRLSSGG